MLFHSPPLSRYRSNRLSMYAHTSCNCETAPRSVCGIVSIHARRPSRITNHRVRSCMSPRPAASCTSRRLPYSTRSTITRPSSTRAPHFLQLFLISLLTRPPHLQKWQREVLKPDRLRALRKHWRLHLQPKPLRPVHSPPGPPYQPRLHFPTAHPCRDVLSRHRLDRKSNPSPARRLGDLGNQHPLHRHSRQSGHHHRPKRLRLTQHAQDSGFPHRD